MSTSIDSIHPLALEHLRTVAAHRADPGADGAFMRMVDARSAWRGAGCPVDARDAWRSAGRSVEARPTAPALHPATVAMLRAMALARAHRGEGTMCAYDRSFDARDAWFAAGCPDSGVTP
jgi:hypothetical protein